MRLIFETYHQDLHCLQKKKKKKVLVCRDERMETSACRKMDRYNSQGGHSDPKVFDNLLKKAKIKMSNSLATVG